MVQQDVIILAIESSCDDTSAAILRNDRVLSNVIAGQKVHQQYGGVVPELASRAHMQHIVPVVDIALKNAGVDRSEIGAVAFTQSPGLIGSLLVGACFAKGFAQGLNIPLIAVRHVKAHVLAHWIDDPKPSFPFVCLTVSGGHTQIVLCKDHLTHEVIGTTLDDAAGEAFDKVAKMLGLGYPGGPILDKLAQDGDPLKYKFPVASTKGYDFSFSGIKTSVLYFLQKQQKVNPDFIKENLKDICASVQYTIVRSLIDKLEQAALTLNVKEIGIAGGVSANSALRSSLMDLGHKHQWNTYVPTFEYCTDNAAMIGITAYYQWLHKDFATLDVIPSARS